MPPDGYAWWYIDALSDCGRHGVSVIAFIGSVFSPYYAWARRSGPADPINHCAMNVALYGPGHRWSMTERGRHAVAITPTRLQIGPSTATWHDGHLQFDINEIAAPIPRRLAGTIRVALPSQIDHEVILDAQGRHRWRPYAPHTRVEVEMTSPALSWSGPGYVDSNHGDEPLERAFAQWSWSRLHRGHESLVLYDAIRRDGTALNLARIFDGHTVRDIIPPPPAELGRGLWGVARPTRADAGTTPRLLRKLEDAPFYTRSEIATRLLGQDWQGVHESLDLDRFRQPVVKLMLPFRMPRRARHGVALD